MTKTELILFHRPNSGGLVTITDSSATSSNYNYAQRANPNQPVDPVFIGISRPSGNSGQGVRVDLYDNVSIPLTYTILDIREPDKRKTSWSKSIKIPGTKNNNRIFTHIYELGKDGWITIGNRSVYQGFNPNIRKEVIILNDGIQVFKGNMQLKGITKDRDGNIEYDIALSGDLTSLFFDVGNAKLSDLDFSEWDHEWSRLNIMNSWSGTLLRNGAGYQGKTFTSIGTKITHLRRQESTGRLMITMQTNHNLSEEDWVRVQVQGSGSSQYFSTANGEWCVAEVIDTKTFTVNYPYPKGLLAWGEVNGDASDVAGWNFQVSKVAYTGRGYVYPMISWGDEYDQNSFPVTSFVPGYYVKELWDKIFESTNSSYESDFLDSQFFKRLIIIQKKSEYKASSNDVKARTFRVGTTASYTTVTTAASGMNGLGENKIKPYVSLNLMTTGGATSSQSAANLFYNITSNDPNSSSLQNRFKFDLESYNAAAGTGSFCDGNCDGYDGNAVGGPVYNNWDVAGKKWNVPRSGEYQLSAAMKISAWMDMNGYKGSTANGTASFIHSVTSTQSCYYYPRAEGTFEPWGDLNGGQQATGVRVHIALKRKRQGVVSTIQGAEQFIEFKTNGNQWWRVGYNTASNPAPGWKYFGRYQPTSWENRDVSINFKGYFNAQDEVWLEARVFNQFKEIRDAVPTINRKLAVCFYETTNVRGSYTPLDITGDFFVKIEPVAYMWNAPSDKSSENSIIRAQEFLPKDMTCKDLLLSVIKMFNLHIEADRTVERKYYIEPRDDYYYDGSGGATDYVDWTTKVDEDSVEIIPMGALISKYYTFENKSESDYWNKKFKEERGREYMKYTKEVENDFLKNETKVTVPLGSTVMINNPEGSDVVMPSIVQRESSGAQKPVSNSAPRMLIYGGIRPYSKQGLFIPDLATGLNPTTVQSGWQGWEMLSSLDVVGGAQNIGATSSGGLAYYAYAGTVDSPQDPMYDLNWFNMEEGDFVYWDNARWSTHNLFNAYWKNFITEISDPSSALVKCKIRLTPSDIFNLDFRKIYVVDRNYFRLQKVVDYDPNGDGLTQVELLKLKFPSRFTRRSVYNWEVIETTTIDKGIIPNINVYTPPKPIKPNFGYTNTSPGSLSNNPTIGIKGKGNFVGSGKNIDVIGDENSIGDGVINVNINGGSGNAVSGGLRNVSLIGTSKRVVNESDVTYINGVRYKNGVAISRCNVISGGTDKVIDTNMSINSTINVVNGGEDIVAKQGSSTYENVINAGIDAILPDVAELGITTTTTPYPKTNLSGGAGYSSPTDTLVTVVRRASENANNIQTDFGESS